MQQRKPRFEPIPQGKYVGHEPHLILLEHIYKHRFIDSRLAELLLQGLLKRDAVIRNLNTLFHEGYITRPPSQIKYYQRGGGSRPLISGLAKKGAKLLERHLGHRISHLEWNGDKNATSDTHIQHTLGIARFMILLELSCRQHNVRIIEPEEILTQASSEVRFKKFPFQWTVQYEGQMVGVSPDKVFGLHYLDEPEGKNKAYFFLENDEGGMPLKRSDF